LNTSVYLYLLISKPFDDNQQTKNNLDILYTYLHRNKTYASKRVSDGTATFIGKYGSNFLFVVYTINGATFYFHDIIEGSNTADRVYGSISNGKLNIKLGAFTEGIVIDCLSWFGGFEVIG
jgi:hypothetical protein